MNSLGIYFGTKIISVVETKGKKLINNIRILQSTISAGDLEEKVPNEVKIVPLLKDELKKNKVEAKEATLTISGRDLIIRTFEMPLLPREELKNAVNFEARKYIPFKVEELISDFQFKKIYKQKRKNLVLYVGIKKETLNEYISIMNQLGLKINSIEYSAFSILRLLKLASIREKGILGVVNIDLKEEDEANFMVLEDGFPLFSRDITFMGGPAQVAKTEETQAGVALEKIKKEIRISLDYYYRKFPNQKIEKTFFITGTDYRSDLETFIKEIGLDIQFIEPGKYIDRSVPYSLGFIKGYTGALFNIIKTRIGINLLLAKTRTTKEIGIPSQAIPLIANLKVDIKIVILGLLICFVTYAFGLYRTLPLQKELNTIVSMRPKVSTVGPAASYEGIKTLDSEYQQKIKVMDNLLKKQVYLTELLDGISRVIPEGIYLVDLSFKKEENKTELNLRGIAYPVKDARELDLLNKFIANLKGSPTFTKYFSEIKISSIDQSKMKETVEAVTNFEILCLSYY